MARLGSLALLMVLFCSPPTFAQSRRGELRGAWMGEGYGRDWPAIMKSLHENGFNALFVNFSTGGAAFYPSEVLPVAPGAPAGRDELAEAAKAARQYGIELHVWRINWVLFHCPPEVLARYEKEGRLMRSADGRLARDDPSISTDFTVDWLCPSHPENRRLEKEAMLELVRKYPIAGIQFDYLRFPKPDYCYCDHCRAEFEKTIGHPVTDWPRDVLEGGPLAERYADWRRSLQVSLVAEVAEEARRLRPDLLISLAAWPDQMVARHWVLQDWPALVQSGDLDFICFMNYTTDEGQLRRWLASQRAIVHGQIPLYAGLGAFMMKDAAALAEQIKVAREEGADGFVAFAYYSGDLDHWLPSLRESVTASDPDPMPHRGPTASFSLSGSPALASGERLPAGRQLSVDLTIGTPSPEEGPSADLAGAEQAAAILRQTTDTRRPTQSYEPESPPVSVESGPRLSGRLVLETPQGETIAPLGVFDCDLGLSRAVPFSVPQGRFRIAAYGTETDEHGTRPFVVRSPLLIGVPAEELGSAPAPVTSSADLSPVEQLIAAAAEKLSARGLAGLEGAVSLAISGEGGGEYWLRIHDGRAEWGRGSLSSSRATVSISAKDALAVARGEADPHALWDAGRLTVSGDVYYAQMLARELGVVP